MFFRQLFDNNTCTYTYVIACDTTQAAAMIDPVREHVEQYQRLLSEWKLKLTYVLDTHMHADHVTGSGALKQALQCQFVMGAQTKVQHVDIKLQDGEVLTLGGVQIKAIYTPGHTDDSYCYYVGDRIFSGDTLLIRRTGRTDFQNGDPAAQYDSIFNKLFKLPPTTSVYPAHDYEGMTVSTLEEERQYNPRLQVKSKDEYIALMKNLDLPKPTYMDIAIAENVYAGLGK